MEAEPRAGDLTGTGWICPFTGGYGRAWKGAGCDRRDVKERVAYHDGEYDSSHGRLEDPEEGQAHHLQEGEQMDPAQRDVAQVDKVRLVF